MTLQFPPPASYSPVPGCPPSSCFDPTALLGCYSDIQALTVLISKIVENLAATDPAFQQSIVNAIVKSGSNIPLIGVTNGSDAQPGQVGEFFELVTPVQFPTGGLVQTVSAGVLQPGDWDCWLFLGPSEPMTSCFVSTTPTVPVGFAAPLFILGENIDPTWLAIAGNTTRASVSVPTLIAWSVTTSAPAAGALNIWFQARRAR